MQECRLADGAPIADSQSYRVAMNSYLATGGDNFTVFRDGTDARTGPQDIDALEHYIAAASPLGVQHEPGRAAGPSARIASAVLLRGERGAAGRPARPAAESDFGQCHHERRRRHRRLASGRGCCLRPRATLRQHAGNRAAAPR